MPFCQDYFTHWMMAEKDDWLPESTIPVPFSTAQAAENDRQNSKSDDMQSKPSDRDSKTNQTPALQTQKTLHGPAKLPPHIPHTQSNLQVPAKSQTGGPPHYHSQSSIHGPDTQNTQPRRSSTSHLQSEASFPMRPPGAAAVSSGGPSSVREETDSDLRRPLLDNEEYGKAEALGSGRESEAGLSDRVTEAAVIDFLQQSEGSASESDMQFLANQVLFVTHVRLISSYIRSCTPSSSPSCSSVVLHPSF